MGCLQKRFSACCSLKPSATALLNVLVRAHMGMSAQWWAFTNTFSRHIRTFEVQHSALWKRSTYVMRDEIVLFIV